MFVGKISRYKIKARVLVQRSLGCFYLNFVAGYLAPFIQSFSLAIKKYDSMIAQPLIVFITWPLSLKLMKILRVINVHDMANYLVCNVASNSQSVFPIMNDKALFGVLDIDRPLNKRNKYFDELL